MVLINLYEPSTTLRGMNELFKLMTLPELDKFFRNPYTGKIKPVLINIVDNGPAEQPASPLVQIFLVWILRFLGLSGACQVSFAQYNSKRNFAKRIH